MNDYSIYIEVEGIKPPIGNVYTHESKVTRVIDRKYQHDVSISSGIARIFHGKSWHDAWDRSATNASEWASAQRSDA